MKIYLFAVLLVTACGAAPEEVGESRAEPTGHAAPLDCPEVARCGACAVLLCGSGAAVEYYAAGESLPCHTGETCSTVYDDALRACGAVERADEYTCPDGSYPWENDGE